MPYSRELEALRKAGRFRQRRLFDPKLVDFASNDYLGLAQKSKQLRRAQLRIEEFAIHAPKASMLVNGYHPIHKLFEQRIAQINGFASAIVVGSGYLANLGLIDALVRKKDLLFIDEEYHASGMMAAALLGDRVRLFRHNDPEDLRSQLRQSRARRKIVAIEGIYSMSGDLAKREIFQVCEDEDALLIVDEAHSSGVLGRNLLGVFEHYDISPSSNHIKMGTLGKAYGSYGAYILASNSIISYLENRAKPIIYSTAPSVIDTALSLENMEYIQRRLAKLKKKIAKRRKIIKEIFNKEIESLILTIPLSSNSKALELQDELINRGWLVGAIRQPTVKQPLLRIIPRLGAPKSALKEMLEFLKVKL